MISLKTILDSLKNYFVDNRVIESKTLEVVITNGRIMADLIDQYFPVNAYFILDGTIFNREVYKITASGSGYIEADDILADPTTEATLKVCLIPKAVLDFAATYATKEMPMFKSESIGNYSYSSDKEGVEGFIINSLKPYYNGVIV